MITTRRSLLDILSDGATRNSTTEGTITITIEVPDGRRYEGIVATCGVLRYPGPPDPAHLGSGGNARDRRRYRRRHNHAGHFGAMTCDACNPD